MSDSAVKYEIERSIVFENNHGFAIGGNPEGAHPFIVLRFSESASGQRAYEAECYAPNMAIATRRYEICVSEYHDLHGVSEKAIYRVYSTQRPVDIGTFPKTKNGPIFFVNFDERKRVEQGLFQAWGYLVYDAPLTENQMHDYELRPAIKSMKGDC